MTMVLSDVEAAVRRSWGADTCTPEFRERWSAENPARDQCGVTAMVVNDLFGGELMVGDVYVDGVRTDMHWWNRLAGGIEIDLTREQFEPAELVTEGAPVPRPPVRGARLREEYEVLRGRVRAELGLPDEEEEPW